MGTPGLVLDMPEAIGIPASGPDIYRNVVIPLHLNEESGCRRSRSARRHGASSITCCTSPINLSPSARPIAKPPKAQRAMPFTATTVPLGGWAAGAQPHLLPNGLALPLPKGNDLVFQYHFHPSGKAESEMITPLFARPTAEALRGIYRGLGKRRPAHAVEELLHGIVVARRTQ